MTDKPAEASDRPPAEIDTTVPHSARVWNYWLGGKDNYPADRELGEAFSEIYPGITDLALGSRYFLGRAIRYLAGVAGIRQFLDVGTGLPTVDNTHEVAQRVAPESRVVYVDSDPLVLLHARALLVGTPEGATDYIDADLNDPDKIITAAARTLDFTKPVALVLMQVLGHVPNDGEDERARSIVARLLNALPSGSYLALNDSTDTNPANVAATRRYNESGTAPYYLRRPEQIVRLFEGVRPVEPGVVPIVQWRPDPNPFDTPSDQGVLGGVGKKI
jgi:S-adenosyl methyltransferase